MSDTLATADSLIATQTPGLVTIVAIGNKPTPGHEVRFQDTPIAVFPPQYRLILIEPTSPSADVVTPYRAETNFPSEDIISTVTVFDASGKHEIPVDQAQD